jgi:hypothetical protein
MVLDTKHGLGPLCRELVELQVISVARRNKINTVLRHRPGAAIGNRGESFSGSPSGKDLLQEYYRAGKAYGFLDRRQSEEFPSGLSFSTVADWQRGLSKMTNSPYRSEWRRA